MAMSPEQRQRMNELCHRIQIENDQKKFTVLAEELLQLMESAEPRSESESQRGRGHQSKRSGTPPPRLRPHNSTLRCNVCVRNTTLVLRRSPSMLRCLPRATGSSITSKRLHQLLLR
jgi:hypothetical protein